MTKIGEERVKYDNLLMCFVIERRRRHGATISAIVILTPFDEIIQLLFASLDAAIIGQQTEFEQYCLGGRIIIGIGCLRLRRHRIGLGTSRRHCSCTFDRRLFTSSSASGVPCNIDGWCAL